MPRVEITVNGKTYAGWKRAAVTRGIESLVGAFTLAVSDRPGSALVFPIAEGDACKVAVEGQTVITGYVDRRRPSFDAHTHEIEIAGRDKAGDLVDCSAVLGTWQLTNQTVDRIVAALAKPFGVPVRVAPGLALGPRIATFAINPGETAHEAIERAVRKAGVVAVSDGAGAIVLTQAGSERATTALVEGQNILAASWELTHAQRFHKYIVAGQHFGSDEFFGEEAAGIEGTATDPNVRAERVLYVRSEGIATKETARRRAQWEAVVRAGRAANLEIRVQGWQQADGSIWPVNALVPVRSPLLGIDGELLITQATYTKDAAQGATTTLTLKRPDAFKPEPDVTDDSVLWNLNP